MMLPEKRDPTMLNRPTMVVIIRRDTTVPEFGVGVAHACEVLLDAAGLKKDVTDVVIKGARNEEVLLEVEKKFKEHGTPHYAFREEAASPHTGEAFRLAGQLVSIGIKVGERDVVLALPALEGLHALEDLDGPKVVRVQCEAVWRGYRKKEPDGSPWRCKNMCAPGSSLCSKKNCLEEREKLA